MILGRITSSLRGAIATKQSNSCPASGLGRAGLAQAVPQLGFAPQEVFQLLEQPGKSRVLLQRNMVLAGECDEPGAGYSGRQFAAQFDRNERVVANMHDERRRLHLR